ncbi:hypothetical protein GCM10023238_05000 [Streptomyces heliomycini]
MPSREDGHSPAYSRVSGPAAGTVASITARTLTDLADHIGTGNSTATPHPLGPVKYKRVHALTHADLGAASQPRPALMRPSQPGPGPGPHGGHDLRPDRKAITSIRTTLPRSTSAAAFPAPPILPPRPRGLA